MMPIAGATATVEAVRRVDDGGTALVMRRLFNVDAGAA
jgi:hypothetical protein